MIEAKPLVTLGMPLRNEGKHIAETLENLLKQDYPNFEIVISDNASSDGTREVCQAYQSKDSRISYHRLETPVDANENFNRLVSLAKGEFFAWASGHDRHASNFISALVEPLISDPAAVLSYSEILPISSDGKPLGKLPTPIDTRGINGPVLRLILSFWHLGGYQIYGLFRTSAMKKTHLFPPRIMGPDLVMLSELALLGTFACVRAPLYSPRMNWTSETDFNKVLERYKRTMFFQKKPSSFPAWHYFAKQLSTLSKASIGVRRKLFLLPIFIFLFMIKNFQILRDDFRRLTCQQAP